MLSSLYLYPSRRKYYLTYFQLLFLHFKFFLFFHFVRSTNTCEVTRHLTGLEAVLGWVCCPRKVLSSLWSSASRAPVAMAKVLCLYSPAWDALVVGGDLLLEKMPTLLRWTVLYEQRFLQLPVLPAQALGPWASRPQALRFVWAPSWWLTILYYQSRKALL